MHWSLDNLVFLRKDLNLVYDAVKEDFGICSWRFCGWALVSSEFRAGSLEAKGFLRLSSLEIEVDPVLKDSKFIALEGSLLSFVVHVCDCPEGIVTALTSRVYEARAQPHAH